MAAESSRWEKASRRMVTGFRELRQKRLPSARRYVPFAMIVTGAGLLLYVAVQYGQMYLAQKRLVEQWAMQQQQTSAATADSNARTVSDGLTRLSIPKINLNAIVVEGTSHRALLLGPGHLSETAEPGEPGNSVISAHRDTFFRHLYELAKGDLITVQRHGKIYRYEVSSKKIVKPEDVSVTKPSSDARLTLITCYPTFFIGPAPDRLVIVSKLVEGPEENSAVAQSDSTAATAPKVLKQ